MRDKLGCTAPYLSVLELQGIRQIQVVPTNREVPPIQEFPFVQVTQLVRGIQQDLRVQWVLVHRGHQAVQWLLVGRRVQGNQACLALLLYL